MYKVITCIVFFMLSASSSANPYEWQFNANLQLNRFFVSDTAIFVAAEPLQGSNRLYALDHDGNVKWEAHDAIESNAAFPIIYSGESGNVYVAQRWFNELKAYDATGKKIWSTDRYKYQADLNSITEFNKEVILTMSNGRIASLSIINGKEQWLWRTNNEKDYIFSMISEGNLFTLQSGYDETKVYELDQKGQVKWHQSLPEYNARLMRIVNGAIYLSDNRSYLSAYDFNGKKKWRYSINEITAAPVVDEEGTVYIGIGSRHSPGDDSRIIAINKEGDIINEVYTYDFDTYLPFSLNVKNGILTAAVGRGYFHDDTFLRQYSTDLNKICSFGRVDIAQNKFYNIDSDTNGKVFILGFDKVYQMKKCKKWHNV